MFYFSGYVESMNYISILLGQIGLHPDEATISRIINYIRTGGNI